MPQCLAQGLNLQKPITLGASFLLGDGAHGERGCNEAHGEGARLEIFLWVLPKMHGGHVFQELPLGLRWLRFRELEA